MEADPIGLAGESYSTYAYAKDDPIGKKDPLGLDPWSGLNGGVTPGEAQASALLAEICGESDRAAPKRRPAYELTGRERTNSRDGGFPNACVGAIVRSNTAAAPWRAASREQAR
jgi:hypothetical protein